MVGGGGYGVSEAAVAELTEGCGCCRAWRNRAGLVWLLGALGGERDREWAEIGEREREREGRGGITAWGRRQTGGGRHQE